jgi:hypothetical protein
MCAVSLSERTTFISLYSIHWLVFLMEARCVLCEVLAESLYVRYINLSLSHGLGQNLQPAFCEHYKRERSREREIEN